MENAILLLLPIIALGVGVVGWLVYRIHQLLLLREGELTRMTHGQQQLESVLQALSNNQKHMMDVIYHNNQHHDSRMETVRTAVDNRLRDIQSDNNSKLEQMRMVVEEKLQSTLEKRLHDSFEIVSQRLDLVHRGLGEMQSLASSVGDLKNLMSNVKVRGIWGEVQLEAILTQMLLPGQYEKNTLINPHKADRVEFAIRLPGSHPDDHPVLLPIDSKFPMSDFERLCEASLGNDLQAIELQSKNLESFIKKSAKTIADKYILPPYSTDFAIMFLPLESLYAEVLRRPGIVEAIQRDYRVIIAGPTTLAAILNSLQMGFRTLAIAQRSSEVWEILETIKKEFNNFTTLLAKTRIKLEQAGQAIATAEKKSIGIEKKLVHFSKHQVHGVGTNGLSSLVIEGNDAADIGAETEIPSDDDE